MADLSNPHDRYFRETLAQPTAARDFLRYYLPTEVAALLDPDETPELMRDSFVEPELHEHLSDLLYRVRLRNARDAYVYILIEHKSYPYPEVAFQLLRYMVQIWEGLRRRHSALHPIVPMVVYHGAVEWRQGDRLHELFPDLPDALKPYTPDYRYSLCDLSHFSDAELQGEALLRAAMPALKYAFRKELRERLSEIMRLMYEVVQAQRGLDALEALLRCRFKRCGRRNFSRCRR